MKKYMLAFALVAILPVVSADASQNGQRRSSSYYTGQTAKGNTYKTVKRGGYSNSITNNIYYTQKQPAAYYNYNNTSNTNNNYYSAQKSESFDYGKSAKYESFNHEGKKQNSKSNRSSQTRKYFLAHPFFQPLEGKFGSVTDVSYAQNNFNFDLLNMRAIDIDTSSPTYNTVLDEGILGGVSAKQQTNSFVVKEDFSYGISDSLAIIAMAQYHKTKVEIKDWSVPVESDSASDSGINIFGVGLQGRFVDNDKWIAMVSGYFQHQRDTANTFIGELKAGYKINRTTLYGLGRFGFSNLIKGDTYGAFVDGEEKGWFMLSYNTNVKNVVYAEGGLGAFAVLNKYFTLNGEAVFGHYDWHNQINVKGAIGYQPADMFALNLYASTSVYDSGKGKTRQYMNYVVSSPDYATPLAYETGDYKIKDYNEWKIGVQAILYF
jgi:hypothetical protein